MSEATNPSFAARARFFRGGNMGQIFLRVGLVILLLVAGGLITLVSERLLLGRGGANEVRVTTFQDWRLVCPPLTTATPDCSLSLDVLRDTGGILLTLSMANPAPNSQMSLTVPHGVLLESGLGFSIGTEPVRVRPYETCTNMGCVALVTLDADTLKSLSTNMAGQIAVALPNNPQPVNIPFSLRGFADGYAELQRTKARRTSFFGLLYR